MAHAQQTLYVTALVGSMTALTAIFSLVLAPPLNRRERPGVESDGHRWSAMTRRANR